MSFRIGRKFAQHVYPEPRRSAGADAFARNSAIALPGSGTPIGEGGVQVAWTYIESEGSAAQPGSTFDVPITPRSTGVIRVIGTVQIENGTEENINASVQVQVNGSSIVPPVASSTVDAQFGEGLTDGIETLSFVLDLIATDPVLVAGVPLSVGVLANIELLVTATADGLVLGTATLDIQELPAATG